MRLRPTFFLAALGASVLASPRADATGLLELVGAPTSANGPTARVLGHGAETAYFNPGLLARAEPTLELGYAILHVHQDIRLRARPGGIDVAPSVYEADLQGQAPTFRPLATEDIPTDRADQEIRDVESYLTFGVVRPLFDEKLTLGFYGLFPLNAFQQTSGYFPDERDQFFDNAVYPELLGDRLRISSMSLALGSQPIEWLSLGVGLTFAINTEARTGVYVPDGNDQEVVLLTPEIRVTTALRPNFGIAVMPIEQLRLTATAHLPTASETDGANQIRFWNYDAYEDGKDYVPQEYSWVQAYQPLRISLGAAWHQPREGKPVPSWELGANVIWEDWSRYQDRNAERPTLAWSDTLQIGVGGGVAILDKGRLTGDFVWYPTPVPEQDGRSNYVDHHRLAGAVGFETPIDVLGARFGIGVYLNWQAFVGRSATKAADSADPVIDEYPDASRDPDTFAILPEAQGLQTNNPGYPGWDSSGFMLGGGLAIRTPR